MYHVVIPHLISPTYGASRQGIRQAEQPDRGAMSEVGHSDAEGRSSGLRDTTSVHYRLKYTPTG